MHPDFIIQRAIAELNSIDKRYLTKEQKNNLNEGISFLKDCSYGFLTKEDE